MNREIKFRAWMKIWDESQPIKGKMFYQILPTGDLKTWIIAFDNDEQYDGNFIVGEDMELMQFTGLKDKNGIEIYEGDIISSPSMPDSPIEFHRGSFSAVYADGSHDEWEAPLWRYTIEVIGNIYESPELIKEMR